eukprot:4610889-Pyramimonas_sp.AAC.1
MSIPGSHDLPPQNAASLRESGSQYGHNVAQPQGPAGGFGGPPGAAGSKCEFESFFVGPSKCPVRALLGRLGRLVGHLRLLFLTAPTCLHLHGCARARHVAISL